MTIVSDTMNSVSGQQQHGAWSSLCHSPENLAQHIRMKLGSHHPVVYAYRDIDAVEAAVLIPIFFKNGEAHLLFTKRTDKVEHHKGQISFPGGRRDTTDRDLLFTALRETEEEVGIRADEITIYGQTDRFLTNTHYMVTPFVGGYSFPYAYRVNRDEIDRLIEVPLIHLLDARNFELKPHVVDGHTWQVHYYHYNGDIIWGVTGFLLSNFLTIAFGLSHMFPANL